MFVSVCAGLDVAAITKLVVETVRERDETEFAHHSQTLETGTSKVWTIQWKRRYDQKYLSTKT